MPLLATAILIGLLAGFAIGCLIPESETQDHPLDGPDGPIVQDGELL